MTEPEKGYYYHYKHDPKGEVNNYAYEVLNVAHHTEIEGWDKNAFVIYRPLYESSVYKQGKHWDARPLTMFMEKIEKDGKSMDRFTKITDPKIIFELDKIRDKMYKSGKGTEYIGVNCTFWCHDGAGNVLMHKRSQKCKDEQGKWDCGAGGMEYGETFEETVSREVLEEYGAKPKKIEYIASGNILREHNGKRTHWVKNLHWVLVDPKEVKNNEPEKIEEIGWFPLDKLPSPLHSQIHIEVDLLKKFLKNK